MPILLGQPDIVEHGPDVEQLRIISQTFALTGQGAEQLDPSGVVIEKVGLLVADQLRQVFGHLAVGDFDARYCLGHGATST
jgi:hypothetical protein